MEKASEETILPENGSLVENIESRPLRNPIPSSSKRQRDEADEASKRLEPQHANGKRSKMEESPQINGLAGTEDGAEKDEDESKLESANAVIPPAVRSNVDATAEGPLPLKDEVMSGAEDQSPSSRRSGMANGGRWRTHQMAEDYVDSVGKLMYPGTRLRPYGYDAANREYPLEHISVLAFLQSPLRRPSIIEKWSPYEVAVFEGAMLHHGKEFHLVSREIKTKSTKEVIDFYYIWKKTAHYKKWKDQYMSDLDLELALDPPIPGKS